jgi:hypothetical protein
MTALTNGVNVEALLEAREADHPEVFAEPRCRHRL